MARVKSFEKIKKQWLGDPEVRKEYDALGTDFQIAAEITKARMKARMTQAELAERIGTKPTAVSRLESPHYGKVSISTLRKVANALGCELQVQLLPKKRRMS